MSPHNGRESATLTYKGEEKTMSFLLASTRTRYGGGGYEWASAGTRIGSKEDLYTARTGLATDAPLERCERTE